MILLNPKERHTSFIYIRYLSRLIMTWYKFSKVWTTKCHLTCAVMITWKRFIFSLKLTSRNQLSVSNLIDKYELWSSTLTSRAITWPQNSETDRNKKDYARQLTLISVERIHRQYIDKVLLCMQTQWHLLRNYRHFSTFILNT